MITDVQPCRPAPRTATFPESRSFPRTPCPPTRSQPRTPRGRRVGTSVVPPALMSRTVTPLLGRATLCGLLRRDEQAPPLHEHHTCDQQCPEANRQAIAVVVMVPRYNE